MEGPGLRPVENENSAKLTRTTQEGKTYTYVLNVIQQPARARACGSGAKSSADRRPVDPPPIVDLKIYEGDSEDGEDVTFSLNSTWFLFVTLEQSRVMAQSRGQQSSGTQPVLTGTPVAGMVYLDRPSPAGYFIFPDLSVRHEGNYRLTFALLEQVKDPNYDDLNDPAPMSVEHVTHRMEVKSSPFHVYSAKKFPGLSESTTLSRTVAEQGCRVRIRRDVRMRKRDETKRAKGGWDGYEDETADARSRMTATPELAAFSPYPPVHGMIEPSARPRSNSIISHHSMAGVSRRSSVQDIAQGYHAYGAPPHTPHNAYPQQSPHGPAPSPMQKYAPPPFMSQQSTMQPPPPSYQPHAYHAPSLPLPSSQHQGYYHNAPQSQSGHQISYAGPNQNHRQSVDYSQQTPYEHRRSSTGYGPPPPLDESTIAPPLPAHHSWNNHESSRQGYTSPFSYPSYHSNQAPYGYGSSEGYNSRPTPAEPVHPPAQLTGAHATPLSARSVFSDRLPSLNTSLSMISNKHLEPASPEISAPSSSTYTHTPSDSHKRQYGQVFNTSHMNQPLRLGARPSTPGQTNTSASYSNMDEEPEYDVYGGSIKMAYRRADGRHIMRHLPPHC